MIKHTTFFTTLLLASSMAFAANTFETADTNRDSMVSAAEYQRYVFDYDVYTKRDTNNDSLLNEEELGISVFDADDFSSWDADGDTYLTYDELNISLFDYYDEDDSGYLDNDEWNKASDDGWFDM
ncbi:hypothetical protein [Arsukibacterium indicum]|uniref:EF-hand domain-containing protein n=1 Tax=Arsukibacterium indicum TaxID=2848612 RepID=A0ABS6MKF9_9GAMM|nr:hypothetical protein [Arsukibacterium indicum]MBV2129307.1 hypothetical protein [Arsukibacterium indicum]